MSKNNSNNNKQIININNKNSIENEDLEEEDKSVVLEEEKYVDSLSRIIQRDYFPDLPNLKNQLEWLEAVESNDISRMQSIQLQSIRRANTVSIRQHNTTTSYNNIENTPSNSFDTPNINNNIEQTPSHSNRNNQIKQQDNEAIEEKDIIKDISLDQFVANYKSEDDASYSDIAKKNKLEHQLKYKWMDDQSKKQNQLLLLGDSNTKNAPDTWTHTIKNRLMYYPEGKSVSDSPSNNSMLPPKSISKENTRITVDYNESATPSKQETPFHSLSLPEQLARLQKMDRDGKRIDASSLGLLATPQLTPNNLIDGGESPLMTWGRIDGTPLLLPNMPISTPLDPLSSTRGSFKIPETPHREKIAHSLADKSNNNSTNKKNKKIIRDKTPTNSIESLSPAAQRLLAMRTPNRGSSSASPLLGKDQQLRKSYQQTPKSTLTTTPKSTPKSILTPSHRITSTPKSSQPSTPLKEKSITDDLLNF